MREEDFLGLLSALRNDIANLRHDLAQTIKPHFSMPASTERKSLVFRFLDNDSSRSPFRVEFSNQSSTCSLNCSPVLGVTLFVLLKDLKSRTDGGIGVQNPKKQILEILTRYEGHNKRNEKSITQAYYRLKNQTSVFDPNFERQVGLNFLFNNDFRLEVKPLTNKELRAEDLLVQIDCQSKRLSASLEQIKMFSMLDRVRQQTVAHVLGGPDGFDQLFLELFDHNNDVHEKSMFFKPSIISYPDELLEVLGASTQDIKRKEIMQKELQGGRCTFQEILPRSSLRDMTTHSNGHFKLYGQVPPDMVELHILQLIQQVKQFSGYELMLTSAPLPFLLSTFEISSASNRIESFTVLFRQLIREHDADVDCIAICDAKITSSIVQHVFSKVGQHPTSESDSQKVLEELESSLAKLNS